MKLTPREGTMEKAMNMGKSSATGSFQLLIGVAGSTIIMALGQLILGWLLTRDQVGLYGVAIIPSSMIAFFRDWGVNTAITKEIAHLRASGKEYEIHDVIVSGVIFEVISGALLSVVCFILSDTLASFLKMPDASPLIAISSIAVFAGAIAMAATNIFIGFEKMKLSSLTSILTAIVKTGVGPFLVILGYGALGAVIGYAASVVIGGLIGIIIVYFALFRPVGRLKTGKSDIRVILRRMLSYGIPLTVYNTVLGVVPLLFSFLMASIAGTALMGDYYIAGYFVILITFFTSPISTALFPTFAKVDPKKEPELLKTVFASSVKYTSVLVIPATILIMVLSGSMVNTLWPGKYPNAPLFLSMSATINLFVVIGYLSLIALLTGLGETRKLMIQSLLSLVLSLPIIAVLFAYSASLSPMAGMLIGIAGIVVANLPGWIWGLMKIWQEYHVKLDLGISAKILASAVAAGLITVAYLSASYMLPGVNQASRLFFLIQLVPGFVLFLLVYLTTAPLMGAVNSTDLLNMRSMFSGLGVVSKIINLPLRIMEKALNAREKPAGTNPNQKPQ